MQECLNSARNPSIHATPLTQLPHTLSVFHGKLVDNPDVMPAFTIEYVLDYLIYQKEEDCLRAEDWRSFKAGGFRLFKEGHVQNIMVSQQGTVFGVECKCLLEMKIEYIRLRWRFLITHLVFI